MTLITYPLRYGACLRRLRLVTVSSGSGSPKCESNVMHVTMISTDAVDVAWKMTPWRRGGFQSPSQGFVR